MVEVFKFREVRGTFTARLPDTGDTDQLPDRVMLNGYGTLRPNIRGTSVVFTEVGEFAVPRTRQVAFVDGELMVEVVDGESSILQPLFLEVTVDERANQEWSWTLTFDSLTIGEWGEEISHPALSFPVEDGDGPLELSTVATTVTRNANFITRGQRGYGVTDVSATDGEFVIEYGDGKSTSVPIPTGAQIDDPQVAAVVTTGPQTVQVLDRAYRRSVSVLEYGADQNAADNTAAFQAALNDLPGGGEVFVPEGEYTFNNSSPMTVPSHVTVRGQGASLVQTRNGPLLAVEGGATQVAFTGLVIRGTMPNDLLATIQNQAGIRAYSTPDKPITQLSITHCRFARMQGSGIQLKNVHDLRIQNNDIIHHGSSAIGCYSIKRGLIEGNVVEGTGQLPAYSSNCYGIFVSTLESDGPVGSEAAPRSTDVMVRGNIIRNQVWSALDTHVGKRISFIGNHLDNCVASGINAVFISTSGPNVPLSPQDIVIADNLITHSDRHEDDPMLQQAILLRGSQALNDPTRELATGVIRGNVIRGYGRLADSNSGAIFIGSTLGVIVDGNTMLECRSTGVQVRDAKGTTISNNTFVDLWRSAGAAVAVYLRIASDIHMDITITGNKYVRGALTVGTDIPAGSSVNSSAIHGSADARIVTVEGSNEWGNASHAANIRRMSKSIASKSVLEGTGPPTGTKPDGNSWVLGDQIENSDPEGGAPMGWVCVNGGTPGSWRAFGQIEL